MKKIWMITTTIILFSCSNSFATQQTSIIHVNINNINSQTGYYCLEVFVGYDHEKGCGIPTALGTDFINQYLIGIQGSPKNYIKFGSSTAPYDTPYWPSNPDALCKFTFNKNAHLNVALTPTNCSITTA